MNPGKGIYGALQSVFNQSARELLSLLYADEQRVSEDSLASLPQTSETSRAQRYLSVNEEQHQVGLNVTWAARTGLYSTDLGGGLWCELIPNTVSRFMDGGERLTTRV